ncbi:MAG: hypothetical protein HBSAPP03_01350 [Phycisphaerae bacterium]|nr:MAG: hypothetical protein HBSAPP03_01350 [Phycisphaerae bacterium]
MAESLGRWHAIYSPHRTTYNNRGAVNDDRRQPYDDRRQAYDDRRQPCDARRLPDSAFSGQERGCGRLCFLTVSLCFCVTVSLCHFPRIPGPASSAPSAPPIHARRGFAVMTFGTSAIREGTRDVALRPAGRAEFASDGVLAVTGRPSQTFLVPEGRARRPESK